MFVMRRVKPQQNITIKKEHAYRPFVAELQNNCVFLCAFLLNGQ